MKRIFIFVLLVSSNSLFSQVLPQIDNYSGTQQVYLNPSAIVGSKYSSFLNLGNAELTTSILGTPNETVLFSGQKFKLGGNRHRVTQSTVYGPAFMKQIRNEHAFSINTRYMAAQEILSNKEFISWLLSENPSSSGNIDNFSASQNAFLEYGLYYAGKVLDIDRHYLKAGVGYSILKGVLNTNSQINGSINYGNSGLQLNNVQTAISSTAMLHNADVSVTDLLLGKVSAGKGGMFSAGLTYEFKRDAERYHYPMDGKVRTDPAANSYLLKVGLALNNVGKLRFDGESLTGTLTNSNISHTEINSVKNTSELLQLLDNNASFNNSIQEITYKLPQFITAQIEAHLGKNWYAGITHLKYEGYSKTYIGPRSESYGGAFSVAGVYNSLTKKWGYGVNLRAGIFTFGTENIEGFFNKNQSAAHVYAGISLALKQARRINDRDGDTVSDARDQCIDLPGLLVFKGCPDTDGDGIEDRLDDCPNEAGPTETKGCPDTDGDGIFDKNDECPYAKGPVSTNGCPDSDGDGIPDQEDKCPNEAGLPQNGGCPDTDADGIWDNEDSCPQIKGLKLLMGCPLEIESNLKNADNLISKIKSNISANILFTTELIQEIESWKRANPSKVLNLIFSGEKQDTLLQLAGSYKDQMPDSLKDMVNFTIREGKDYTLIIDEK